MSRDWTVRPGTTLADWLEENRLSSRVAAVVAGRMPRERFQGILDGTVRITEDDAARLQHLTGVTAGFWLNHERMYREDLADGKKDFD